MPKLCANCNAFARTWIPHPYPQEGGYYSLIEGVCKLSPPILIIHRQYAPQVVGEWPEWTWPRVSHDNHCEQWREIDDAARE